MRFSLVVAASGNDLSPGALVAGGTLVVFIVVAQIWWVLRHPLGPDPTPLERTGRISHVVCLVIGSPFVIPVGLYQVATGISRLW